MKLEHVEVNKLYSSYDYRAASLSKSFLIVTEIRKFEKDWTIITILKKINYPLHTDVPIIII